MNRHFSKEEIQIATKYMMLNIICHQGNANQKYNEIHSTLPRTAMIKKTDNENYWQGHKKVATLRQENKMVQLLCKIVWQSLKRLYVKLSYDPGIPLPGEIKTYAYTKTCAQMFIMHIIHKSQKRETTHMSIN